MLVAFAASKWTQFEGQQKAVCRKLKANASNETHVFSDGGKKGVAKRVQKVSRILGPGGPNLTVKCGVGKIVWAKKGVQSGGQFRALKQPARQKKRSRLEQNTRNYSGRAKQGGAKKFS